MGYSSVRELVKDYTAGSDHTAKLVVGFDIHMNPEVVAIDQV